MMSLGLCKYKNSTVAQSVLSRKMSSYKWANPLERGKLKKGPWTFEEDIRLLRYIKIHGEGRWSALAKAAGLQRCGKSCRLRWVNYLRPDLKRGSITPEEERMIIDLHARWGNRWSLIADRIPGRTDNEIKNYWRSHLRRKLQSANGSRQYNDQTPNSQGIHVLPVADSSPLQSMPTVTSSPSLVQGSSTVNSCLNDNSNICGLKTDIPEPPVALQLPASPATVPANQATICNNNVQNEPGGLDGLLEPRLYTCPSFEPDSLSLLLCQFYSGFGFEGSKDNAAAACSSLPSVSDVALIPAALYSSRDYESDACMDLCTDLLWNIDPICPPPLEDAELLLDQL